MQRQILRTAHFNKKIKGLEKKYKGFVQDLKTLYDFLEKDSTAGDEIFKHCYKLRIKNSSINKGKSGGFRVIYYYAGVNSNIYLIDIYSKSDKASIKESDLIQVIDHENLD